VAHRCSENWCNLTYHFIIIAIVAIDVSDGFILYVSSIAKTFLIPDNVIIFAHNSSVGLIQERCEHR